MRKPFVAGNWKLFKTIAEADDMVCQLKPLIAGKSGVEVVVAPVFTALSRTAEALAGSGIKLSAQDCFWEEGGAFTGEVAPLQLVDAGCSHVIIGHSERRQYFGETDLSVHRKTRAAVTAGLTAIVCVGETLAEREADETFAVVERHVLKALEEFTQRELSKVVIAYEPVWAIGTGVTATNDQAQEVHAFIRGLIAGHYGRYAADNMRIIYGGSVKPDNINGLMAQPDIDGALVGGASLQADSFAAIVNFSG